MLFYDIPFSFIRYINIFPLISYNISEILFKLLLAAMLLIFNLLIVFLAKIISNLKS